MLDSLPRELLGEILLRLPLPSLGRLAQGNKHLLQMVCGDEFLWKSKAHGEYGCLFKRLSSARNCENNTDWQELYKAEKYYEAVLRTLSDEMNGVSANENYNELSTVGVLLFDYMGPEISRVAYCPESLRDAGDVLTSPFESLFSTRLECGPPDEFELFIKCTDGTGRFVYYFLRYECSGGYGCIRVGDSALFLLNHLSKTTVKTDVFLNALQKPRGFPFGPPKLSQAKSIVDAEYCPLQNKPLIRYGIEMPHGFSMLRAGFEFLGDWEDINESIKNQLEEKSAEARLKLVTPRPITRLYRRYSEGEELMDSSDDQDGDGEKGERQ